MTFIAVLHQSTPKNNELQTKMTIVFKASTYKLMSGRRFTRHTINRSPEEQNASLVYVAAILFPQCHSPHAERRVILMTMSCFKRDCQH